MSEKIQKIDNDSPALTNVQVLVPLTATSLKKECVICDMCGYVNSAPAAICKMCSNYLTKEEQ